MGDALVVALVALVTVVVTTPLARWLSFKVGAVDEPGGRRTHERPTARLGGLALFGGFLAAVAVGSRLPAFEAVFATTSEPEAIVLAAAVVMAVGLVDDVRGVSAPVKLAGQTLAAGTLALFGVLLRYVYIPGSPGTLVVLATDLAVILTIVAIVAMINAVNLVDGLDGLAAGIVAIAGSALYGYVHFAPLETVSLPPSSELVFAAVVGACLGFLVHNSHPASIFMGDAGAMLLGLLLGAGGVLYMGGTFAPRGPDFAAFAVPVLVPALVLAVPFVDTIWTILRRVRSGKAVFSPDKKHLHHRLIAIGHSHRRAVLIMYYWSALLAFVAVGVGLFPLPFVLAVFGGGCALVVVAAISGKLLRARRRRERPRAADDAQDFVPPFTRSGRGLEKTRSDQRKRGSGRL